MIVDVLVVKIVVGLYFGLFGWLRRNISSVVGCWAKNRRYRSGDEACAATAVVFVVIFKAVAVADATAAVVDGGKGPWCTVDNFGRQQF